MRLHTHLSTAAAEGSLSNTHRPRRAHRFHRLPLPDRLLAGHLRLFADLVRANVQQENHRCRQCHRGRLGQPGRRHHEFNDAVLLPGLHGGHGKGRGPLVAPHVPHPPRLPHHCHGHVCGEPRPSRRQLRRTREQRRQAEEQGQRGAQDRPLQCQRVDPDPHLRRLLRR